MSDTPILIEATTCAEAYDKITKAQNTNPAASITLTNPKGTIDLLGVAYMHALITEVNQHYPSVQGYVTVDTSIPAALIATQHNIPYKTER